METADDSRFDPMAAVPLLAVHAAGLGALWTGVSPAALVVAAALFGARAFGITAGYHRYFSHRSFRTSRTGQMVLALLGASAAQMGPLWWSGHHRRHHRLSDRPGDPHSPVVDGWRWAHMGWLLCRRHVHTPREEVLDLAAVPELAWLDRHHVLVPVGLAAACFALGVFLAVRAPALGTSGAQMLVVGFVWSTLALYHATYLVNSLAHRIGSQRYDTNDGSRNNAALALVMLGDGWHNNHHRFPGAARHGFFWWELDPTWLGLRLLAAAGLVWDLVPVPPEAFERSGSHATTPRANRGGAV